MLFLQLQEFLGAEEIHGHVSVLNCAIKELRKIARNLHQTLIRVHIVAPIMLVRNQANTCLISPLLTSPYDQKVTV